MANKAPWQLSIVYRTDGEHLLNFSSEKEARNHMCMMESALGNKIVKMEVIRRTYEAGNLL